MPTTTMTSREFNQDTGRAKRAAAAGPVVITERGDPSFVLLNFAEYQHLTQQQPSIIELLGMPAGIEDAELDITPIHALARLADLD